MVSFVVVPLDELFEGLLKLSRVLVEDQVEPVLGGPVDPFDLAAGLRMATGRKHMPDADRLEIFIERSGDVSATVVA